MIERAIDKLARRHGAHINEYDANNGLDNAKRLTGKNGMPHIKDFTAGNVFNSQLCLNYKPSTAMIRRHYLISTARCQLGVLSMGNSVIKLIICLWDSTILEKFFNETNGNILLVAVSVRCQGYPNIEYKKIWISQRQCLSSSHER